MKSLTIVDTIKLDEDGNLVIWACAANGLGLTNEIIGKCPAKEGECPRGFRKTFECRDYNVDGE